jgi:hypothetical protein
MGNRLESKATSPILPPNKRYIPPATGTGRPKPAILKKARCRSGERPDLGITRVLTIPPIVATKMAAKGPSVKRVAKVTAESMEKVSWGAKFSLVVKSATMTNPMKRSTAATGEVTWVRDQKNRATPNPDTQAT